LKNNKDSDLKEEIEKFNKELLKMDIKLDENYKKIFETLFEDLKKYGFANEGSEVEIQSRLSENNIIQDNTLLLYNIEGKWC
jgi:predicted transcriptional regulator